MTFYNVQEQTSLPNGHVMLDNLDNFFADNLVESFSMLDNSIYNMDHLNCPENNYPPAQNFTYTEVFRASDMNAAEPCVNGVQHLSSSPLSPPITPGTSHDDNADMDSDCTSCIKCQATATQKRAKRREQNRQSQRKFRAKKEAKLSDAKARIRDLEALVRAQEKTNVELRLTIEELNSRERTDQNARRKVNLGAEKQVTNCRNGGASVDSGLYGSLSVMGHGRGILPPREYAKNK